MIAVKDIEGRAKELDKLGVDYICVHTGYDLQAVGKNSFEDLATIHDFLCFYCDVLQYNFMSISLLISKFKKKHFNNYIIVI